MELIIFLAIGVLAGFTAGLFGVGGGLIIVPILYVVFTQMGLDPAVVMHLALGTSLATIIVTSISLTPVEKTGHFLMVESHQKESFYDQPTIKIQHRI